MRLENWFISNPDASQQEVLKVSIDENLIVKGSAGSGKTNMAIYRAIKSGENNFAIIVLNIALKKMVEYGLKEISSVLGLELDENRVIYEWSWKNRGIEISGDLFCLKGSNSYGLNKDILILKTEENVRFFLAKECYDRIINQGKIDDYDVTAVEKELKVSIDFGEYVDDRFYYTFYRRARWFKEIHIKNYNFNPTNEKFILIPSGYIYKEKGIVDYLIIDEGQDFSLETYKNIFIPDAQKSITIFGDTNQRLNEKGTSIEVIENVFKFPLKKLASNYRVPKTVAKIAQKILPNVDLLSSNMKNNGNSDFSKPIIKKCNSWQEELEWIIDRIQTEDMDDVCILLYDKNLIEKVNNFFAERNINVQTRYTKYLEELTRWNNPIHKTEDTLDFTNNNLPCILDYTSAKGTEFDNVFIPFADEDNNLRRNNFYVAVTRASNRVFITHSRELTSLLKDVNSYDVIMQ